MNDPTGGDTTGPDAAALLDRLASAGRRVVIVATGGGSAAIARLLKNPGASRVVLEGLVPYARESVDAWLGGPSRGRAWPRSWT